jgi:hypothetical protein
MYKTLFTVGKYFCYFYSFSNNYKIIYSVYLSSIFLSKTIPYIYTIGSVFKPNQVILEIETIIDSELGEFELINIGIL